MRAGFECAHQTGDGSFGDFAQESLQLGIGFLDGMEVGAVGRQVAQFGPGCLYQLFDARSLVGGEIVHDDGIARRERGSEAGPRPVFVPGDWSLVDDNGQPLARTYMVTGCPRYGQWFWSVL
jgi:hypothetical protein